MLLSCSSNRGGLWAKQLLQGKMPQRPHPQADGCSHPHHCQACTAGMVCHVSFQQSAVSRSHLHLSRGHGFQDLHDIGSTWGVLLLLPFSMKPQLWPHKIVCCMKLEAGHVLRPTPSTAVELEKPLKIKIPAKSWECHVKHHALHPKPACFCPTTFFQAQSV